MPGRRQILAGLLAAALPGVANARPLSSAVANIVPFQTSPFPYHGPLPDGSGPFLNVERGGRRGHSAPRAGIYWEDETYSDRSVLLAAPAHFDATRPAAIVVFFHGNGGTLQRDVVDRQRVLDQLQESRLNAVLVAPQFAVNAQDSSAGNFWIPGAFARFMTEAAQRLGTLTGNAASHFTSLPIILVAYSGGYDAAAYVLSNGDANRRLIGVILLDAAFGESDKFANWIARHSRTAFFISAYGDASESGNAEIMGLLQANGTGFSQRIPNELARGTIAFVNSNSGHDSFVTEAFADDPLAVLLSRVK